MKRPNNGRIQIRKDSAQARQAAWDKLTLIEQMKQLAARGVTPETHPNANEFRKLSEASQSPPEAA